LSPREFPWGFLLSPEGDSCLCYSSTSSMSMTSAAALSPPARSWTVLTAACSTPHNQGLQQLLADETHWLQRQQWAFQNLEAIVFHTPAQHLLSLRGLSPRWAAYYLDLVGYPPRFDWADQVWAFVGFDTVLDQSGDDNPEKRFCISRRGETFYRNVFSWMGLLVASHHPTFGQTFIAAEERGMGVWGATIHTAHKVHRTCFRLLLDNRPYHDDTHPDDLARWHAYWLAYRRHRREPKKHPHPGPWRPTR